MRILKDYILREILGEYIVVPTGQEAVRFQGIVAVNETGAFLWKYLQENDAVEEELVYAVCTAYEVDRETAMKDICEFLDAVRRRGILIEDNIIDEQAVKKKNGRNGDYDKKRI